MFIELNPVSIIKEIDSSTPQCVLEYINDFFNVKDNVNSLIYSKNLTTFKECINSFKKITLYYPLVEENEIASLFLNPKELNISLDSLNEGLETYIPFITDNLDSNIFDLSFGDKTDKNPKNINILMAYRLCKNINYVTDFNTKEEELFYACEKILTNESERLRFCFLEQVKYMSNKDIIKASYITVPEKEQMTISNKVTRNNSNEVKINNISVDLISGNLKYLQKRLKPKTEEEAVILSHIVNKIYIGESENPIYQYKKFNPNYLPRDDVNFCVKYCLNKEWYNSSKTLIPNLVNLYTTEELNYFSIKESYNTKVSHNNMRSFLSDRWNLPNFYFCIVPYSNAKCSYVYKTPIEEIDVNMLICTGSITKNNLVYFTVKELILHFTNSKLLIDHNNDFYDKYAINKLRRFCKDKLEIKETRMIFNKLLNVVEDLITSRKITDNNLKNMLLTFKDKDNIFRDRIETIYKDIMELAFIMRGKTILGRRPLKTDGNNIETEKYGIFFQDSFDEYRRIINYLTTETEEIQIFVKNTMVIRFSNSGPVTNFMGMKLKSPSIDHNVSLITLIESCFNNKEECLRESSNWILYTTYWYMFSLGIPLDFKIEEIEEMG